ncbi:hypothetical protein SAMN05192529_10919 [Arachidicoccus rhizosphaerae]|uniref:Uncharacterized protein n=1 Tax=Arachidicoccus rhizosphaerae TaxID=551991 RepID=A0A1H3YTG1_9BACT|nr:hypothetical protein [Arachidicoccus rhizosphaerae]SEA14332.1 hypothetical protein SAMN05192529_10919 [Arachidicoccus rhizosphaerae]
MYKTKCGAFNGDSWEDLIQICLRIKYETELYQSVPASPGDCGIEGFTKTGKAFQCYCPDNNITSSSLYEKQRDKITRDLSKLKRNNNRLALLLAGTKIKEWIFVTPEYLMNDLVVHCNKKLIEVKAWSLPIIDANFQIIIHDIDNFAKEIPIALNGTQKLTISPEEADDGIIISWKEEKNELIDNAIRKHTKRFTADSSEVSNKVNSLTESTIKSYFDRESILSNWQRLHPQDYDRFLILTSQLENIVKEQCMFPTTDNNELYGNIRTSVYNKLKEYFSYLDETTITNLTHGIVADWLLRCPLDFE